jgi:hypothetical protein
MDNPWKVILAFVGVFVAGAVFGGLFTLRASAKRLSEVTAPQPIPRTPVVVAPETTVPVTQPTSTTTAPTVVTKASPAPQDRIVPAVMKQLTQRVNPTAEQKERIRPIIARASDDFQRLEREHWQDTARVTARMYEDVAAVLTPEQRVQLEKMRQEGLERMRKAREKQRSEIPVRPPGQQSPQGPPRKSGVQPEATNPAR